MTDSEETRFCDFKQHWLPTADFDPRGRGFYRQCRRCRLEQKAAAMLGEELVAVTELPDGCTRLPDGLVVDKHLANRTIMTQALYDAILVAAEQCSSIHSVHTTVGVKYRTWWDWRADYTREPFKAMNLAIDKILSNDKEELLGNLRRISTGDDPSAVRANEFLLKKLYPDEFGDKVVHDITHRRGADEAAVDSLTDEQLRQADEIRNALASGEEV